jgi:type VI protein secretion system component VasK
MQQNNSNYMKGLLDLQTCIQDIADTPPEQREGKKTGCAAKATQARISAKQTEQMLTNDTEAHLDVTVSELLDAPIKYLDPLLAAQGGDDGGGVCKTFKAVQVGYPFNERSSRDITLEEFNGVFQPGSGTLSQFIGAHKSDLSLQGTQYVHALTSNVNIGPIFLRTLNQLYAIQLAVYPGGAKEPHFEYTISARIPEVGNWKNEKLSIDGQTWSVPEKGGTQKFVWPGAVTQGVSLTLNPGNQDIEVAKYPGPGFPALWSVAHFLNAATYKWQQPTANSAVYIIQGPLHGLFDQPMQVNGQQVIVRFDVDLRGVPFFKAGYLSNFGCPAMNK